MAIIVKKPSDDPWTWLGPDYTIYHFQEDHTNIVELGSRGLTSGGGQFGSPNQFYTAWQGNGSLVLAQQGDGTNRELRYVFVDLVDNPYTHDTFVCSFDFTGPARSSNISPGSETFFGIVLKNVSTGALMTFGIELASSSSAYIGGSIEWGPTLVSREYNNETSMGAAGPFRGRIDVAETLILKAQRIDGTRTSLSYSIDGVSFIHFITYTASDNAWHDLNRLGVGLDVIENGSHHSPSKYATPYAMAIDWIAYL